MARRNDHTREELIELALEQVKTFLADHSYRELSLRQVAAMIGYAPSTLVNLFGSYNLLLLHSVAMPAWTAASVFQTRQIESCRRTNHPELTALLGNNVKHKASRTFDILPGLPAHTCKHAQAFLRRQAHRLP